MARCASMHVSRQRVTTVYKSLLIICVLDRETKRENSPYLDGFLIRRRTHQFLQRICPFSFVHLVQYLILVLFLYIFATRIANGSRWTTTTFPETKITKRNFQNLNPTATQHCQESRFNFELAFKIVWFVHYLDWRCRKVNKIYSNVYDILEGKSNHANE